MAEFLILLTCLTAGERLVNSLVTSVTFYPLLFAPLPFLLWAAVRFGQAGLGIVLCFTALFRFLQTLIQDRRLSASRCDRRDAAHAHRHLTAVDGAGGAAK